MNSTPPEPAEWSMHGMGANLIHELGHLLSLSHTVSVNNGYPCNTGCQNLYPPGPINTTCDDGCADTPTAWDIAQNENNRNQHPACGWGTGGNAGCSNNIMDNNGANALPPCQIGKIHSALEGGMKSYTSCYAVSIDQTFCDIGYPEISYFGKDIIVGSCTGIPADLQNKEYITIYSSSSVSLDNFEINEDGELEVIAHGVCTF